eukprot:scaffold198952_cov47-Attheya_sp.AAC.2
MTLFRVDWGLMELHNPQDRYKEVHFQSKNHVRPSWGSKTTLVIVINGTINNVKITFSLTLHVFMTLFRVDWGLMELHNPQDRYKEVHFQSKNHVKPSWGSKTTLVIVINGTINNVKITFSLTFHVFTTLLRVDWGLME